MAPTLSVIETFGVILNYLQITQRSSLETGLPSIGDLQEATTLTGAGEEFNLERWEILGDAFLKLSVSIALFLNRFVSIDHTLKFS
jgi:hypothetical protein